MGESRVGMDRQEIEVYKSKFIKKYNPKQCKNVALSNAIKAAVQHNKLYGSLGDIKVRHKIREAWKEQLVSHVGHIKADLSINAFEQAVVTLCINMNGNWKLYFCETAGGFRISHSQKSLSVYMKHLWCMGLIEEPPVCPVDRIILSKTSAKQANDVAWGYVNTIDEHRRKFRFIEEAAGPDTVAQWELRNFEG